VVGSYLAPETLQIDEPFLSFARTVRLEDLKFVLDELARLNSTPRSSFLARLDLSRIGVVGHSLGGEAALSSLAQDARLKAAVILDGIVSDESAEGTNQAVLILTSNREKWNEDECELWSHLRGFRLAVNLLGADHRIPSDGVWLTSFVPTLAVSPGMMGSQKTIAVIRNYIAAFFDLNLLSKSQSFPLGGPAEYSTTTVITPWRSLCDNPADLG
jgi:pimeloyl-ACP methyl ester carboxylesterase